MSHFSAQLVLSVGGEDGIWMQMLVFVVLAGVWGVYNLIKNKENTYQGKKEEVEYTYSNQGQRRWQIRTLSELKQERLKKLESIRAKREGTLFDYRESVIKRERGRDLSSGMEILETDFLLGVIEEMRSAGADDVTMRKLSFNELVRRGELRGTGSDVLKVYAKDEDGLYGKGIQCAAMRELGSRTTVRPGRGGATVQKKSEVRTRVSKEGSEERQEVLSGGASVAK